MTANVMFGSALFGLAMACAGHAAEPMTIGEARSAKQWKRMVTVQGVVHSIASDSWQSKTSGPRFMIQNTKARADGDPRTSDGVFAFLDVDQPEDLPEELKKYVPREGDEIVLQGRMLKVKDVPRLSFGTVREIRRREVDLDRELEVVTAAPPDDTDAALQWWMERDGMRIRIPAGAQTIGPLKGWAGMPRGEISLIAAGHPILQRRDPYTRRIFRAAHDLGPDLPKTAVRGMVISMRPPPAKEGVTRSAPRTFDRTSRDLTGGVRFEEGQPYVALRDNPEFTQGPAPDAQQPPAPDVPSNTLRVATFNLENFYDYTDDPSDDNDFRSSKGEMEDYVPASDADYRLRLAGLARQILNDLHAPDVLMLQEVEDQDVLPAKDESALTDNADGVPDVLADLVAEIQKQGSVTYRAGLDRTGADRRGITCGFLWRPDRVRVHEPAPDDPLLGTDPQRSIATESDLVFYGFRAAPVRALNLATPSGGRALSRGVQVLAVQPLAGTDAKGPVYILNNHFKSQPTGFLKQRLQQAAFNARLATLLMKKYPEARVLVGGDLNTYPRPDEATPEKPSDSLGPLYAADLFNLHEELLHRQPPSAYTYVYQGTAQTLDQMFASPGLRARLKDVRVIHINSDFTYNPGTPWRGASDHDPVLATFAW